MYTPHTQVRVHTHLLAEAGDGLYPAILVDVKSEVAAPTGSHQLTTLHVRIRTY